jgi:hypothetical protein
VIFFVSPSSFCLFVDKSSPVPELSLFYRIFPSFSFSSSSSTFFFLAFVTLLAVAPWGSLGTVIGIALSASFGIETSSLSLATGLLTT